MTKEQIFSLIDELQILSTRTIIFTGGEPLLRKDIGDVIDYAGQKNIFTVLLSNGSLISKKIENIKNISLLILSLDGPEQVHDKQRRRRGSYKEVISAIKIAREYKIPVCTVTVLTKYNLSYTNFILDKAKELGFIAFFQPLALYAHADPQQIYSLSPPLSKFSPDRYFFYILLPKLRILHPTSHTMNFIFWVSSNSFPYFFDALIW